MGKYNGTGVTLKKAGTAVVNITSITPPAMSRSDEVVTTLDSTLVEKLPGLLDVGTVNFSGFVDIDHATHKDYFSANGFDGTVAVWKITFNTTSVSNKVLTFSGYESNIQIGEIVPGQYVSITGTLTLTTKPVLGSS
jgi:hypothetical protein